MTFRSLIEKYITASSYKEWEFAAQGKVPLTPSILQKYEKFIPKAYHTTDTKGVRNIMKLQGKRKDLPTFTLGSEGLETGAIRDTEFVVELEGYSSFQSESDFHSALDRNGIRWINSTQGKNLFANNNFTVKMQAKIVKKYNLKDRFSIFNAVAKMDGKGKAQFVKYYMDEAKKLMTKKFMKGLIEDQQSFRNGVYSNNEVLLHNFKVKKIYFVVDDDFNTADIKEFVAARKTFYKQYESIKFDDYIMRSDIRNLKA